MRGFINLLRGVAAVMFVACIIGAATGKGFLTTCFVVGVLSGGAAFVLYAREEYGTALKK